MMTAMRNILPVILLVLAWAATLQAAEKPLHIVVILTDDVGFGDLSLHGCPDLRTPNLDALLQRGVRCTNGYVAAAICAPSRAALLTGRQPCRMGITANHQALPLSERTLADHRQAAGFATACFGKWHLGGPPPRTSPHPTRLH